MGHIRIGDYVMVAAQSGVTKDVPAGRVVAGSPHRPHRDWLRAEACISGLPETRQMLTALMKRVEKLETGKRSKGMEGNAGI